MDADKYMDQPAAPAEREAVARKHRRYRKHRLTTPEKALKLAAELDSGEWDEDLEPQEVAWLLRELVKLIEGK